MTLKEFLEKNPIITQSHLAKAMWPDSKYAKQIFSAKINERKDKTGTQRITEEDINNAIKALDKLIKNIEEFKKQNPTK